MSQQPQKIHVLILRGKPGSGKSYICENFYVPRGWVHASADQFFYDDDGKYNFDPSLIQEAHDYCFDLAKKAVAEGKNVVVDNTNRQLWEFKRYLGLKTNRANTIVKFAVVKVPTYYGSKKKIPRHIIDMYDEKYEPYPGEGLVKYEDGKILFKGL